MSVGALPVGTTLATLRVTAERSWLLAGRRVISFDAVIRESHSSEMTVTDNPVETGVVASDHAFMLPLRLEVEAQVGSVWMADYDQPDPQGDPWRSPDGRARHAWQVLQDLQASRTPFAVQTGLRLYTDMVITSLSCEQDETTATALRFRASLRQILIVNTQTVTYPPRKPGKPHRQAAKKTEAGEKQPTEVTAADVAKRKSLLRSAFDGTSNALDSLVSKAGG